MQVGTNFYEKAHNVRINSGPSYWRVDSTLQAADSKLQTADRIGSQSVRMIFPMCLLDSMCSCAASAWGVTE
jgi:hypothetical protein